MALGKLHHRGQSQVRACRAHGDSERELPAVSRQRRDAENSSDQPANDDRANVGWTSGMSHVGMGGELRDRKAESFWPGCPRRAWVLR